MDGFAATNVTAQQLVFYAYSQTDQVDEFSRIVSLSQLIDLPKWAGSEQFDVTTKVDDGARTRLSGLSNRQRVEAYQKMMQSVLKERFHIDVRQEKREQPLYLLAMSQGAGKLVQSNVPFDRSTLSVDRGQIRATGYPIDELERII